MSREDDLKTLRDFKDEIVEIYELKDKCEKLDAECRELHEAVTNPKTPVFNRKAENAQSKLKAEFDKQWSEKCKSAKGLRLILMIINTAVVSVLSVILSVDFIFDTAVLINTKAAGTKYAENLADSPSERAILVAAQLIFAAIFTAVPWLVTKSRKTGKIKTSKIILFAVLGIIALLPCVTYCIALKYAGCMWALIIPLCTAVLSSVLYYILKGFAAKSADRPVYSAKQKAELAAAAQKDAEVKRDNDRRQTEIFYEYTKNLPTVTQRNKQLLEEKTKELHRNAAALKQHIQNYKDFDRLSENDKNLQTVDYLIYFMETHRADSVKEALQEYDKAVAANQMQMLEQQRIALQQQQIALHKQQMEMQQQHNRNMEYALQQAARQAEIDRANQRDMMYAHYINVDAQLGGIAKNCNKIAESAELFSTTLY